MGVGTGDPDPPPGKLQNIGFLNKTGPDPLQSQSYKASIQCLAIDGPLIVVFESFLPSKKNEQNINNKKKHCQSWTPSGSAHDQYAFRKKKH